jgi:hypothetical protein
MAGDIEPRLSAVNAGGWPRIWRRGSPVSAATPSPGDYSSVRCHGALRFFSVARHDQYVAARATRLRYDAMSARARTTDIDNNDKGRI